MTVPNAVGTLSMQKSETLLFFTLIELALIIGAARIGAALAVRVGQAAVIGEIVVGVLLGPSLFGWIAPQTFNFVFRSVSPEPLQMLANLALVLMMFQIGLEFDFAHLRQRANRSIVLRVSTGSLVLPFPLGFVLGYFAAPVLSPDADRIGSALFVATAFSITALPVLGRILRELEITRTRLGVIAISAAAANDVVGWVLLGLVTALSVASFHGARFAVNLALLAAYVLACTFIVRPLLKRIVRRFDLGEGQLPAGLFAVLLAAVFLSAIASYELGIFAIFGAFLIGVVLFDEPLLVRAWQQRIGDFVTFFFMPIFFTFTGLRTAIGGLENSQAWEWCALTLVLATLGKFGGAYLGARVPLGHKPATILGVMMNTRGLMELVVINVGFDLGAISQQMFTILILMALVSTVITTPLLRVLLPRIGIAVPKPLRAARATGLPT
jgi:Kef-type K+ transport system membrane component KefB